MRNRKCRKAKMHKHAREVAFKKVRGSSSVRCGSLSLRKRLSQNHCHDSNAAGTLTLVRRQASERGVSLASVSSAGLDSKGNSVAASASEEPSELKHDRTADPTSPRSRSWTPSPWWPRPRSWRRARRRPEAPVGRHGLRVDRGRPAGAVGQPRRRGRAGRGRADDMRAAGAARRGCGRRRQ